MPKRIDLNEQRRLITDAAISVINRAGLEGARLRDVAQAANVTTGAVTHYFDGKDAMLESTLAEIVRRTLARIETPVDPDTAGDVTAFVGRACRYLPLDDESRAEWRVWLAFWGRAIADERLSAIHRQYYREIGERMTGPLAALRPAPPAPTRDALRRCSDQVVAAIDGVGTRATLEPEHWPPKRQKETLRALLTPLLTVFADGTSTATEARR
jgi:TetR/AcrR family transcriptional repressor of bet genes